jgi:hypothetical protein
MVSLSSYTSRRYPDSIIARSDSCFSMSKPLRSDAADGAVPDRMDVDQRNPQTSPSKRPGSPLDTGSRKHHKPAEIQRPRIKYIIPLNDAGLGLVLEHVLAHKDQASPYTAAECLLRHAQPFQITLAGHVPAQTTSAAPPRNLIPAGENEEMWIEYTGRLDRYLSTQRAMAALTFGGLLGRFCWRVVVTHKKTEQCLKWLQDGTMHALSLKDLDLVMGVDTKGRSVWPHPDCWAAACSMHGEWTPEMDDWYEQQKARRVWRSPVEWTKELPPGLFSTSASPPADPWSRINFCGFKLSTWPAWLLPSAPAISGQPRYPPRAAMSATTF